MRKRTVTPEAAATEEKYLAHLRRRVTWQVDRAGAQRASNTVLQAAGHRLAQEEGQVAILMAVGVLTLLLVVAGIVIDFGRAYVLQRHLQAAADAAAIAGADALPSASSAIGQATAYGATPAGKNAVPGASETATPWCLRSVTYCYGNTPGGPAIGQGNGMVVKETGSVSTTFLDLVGIDKLNVHAQATACSICGTQPLNIVLVVDRTGSMQGNMDDLRSGLETFLKSLDPSLDWVSLLVLPPAPGGSDCTPASNGAFPYFYSSYPTAGDSHYAVVHWSNDYLVGHELNESSQLVQQIDCMYAQGGTAYQQALVAAQNELQSFPASRQSYQDVIVFETDGAANTAPDSYFDPNSQQTVNGIPLYVPKPEHVYDVQHPCGSALDEANTIKSQGTVVLTVAYAVQQDDGCYEAPHLTTLTGNHWHGVSYKQLPEDTTAEQTLTAMASPNDAYSASNAATMSSAFASIANKIQSAALVPDSEGG